MEEQCLDPDQMLQEYLMGDAATRLRVAEATTNMQSNARLALLKKFLAIEDKGANIDLILELVLCICSVESSDSEMYLMNYYKLTKSLTVRFYIFSVILRTNRYPGFIDEHRHDNYTFNDMVGFTIDPS